MPFKPVPRPWRLRSSRKRQYSECGSPSRLPERQHRAMTEAAAGMVRAGMVRGCRARRRCRDAIDRRAAFADNRRQFQGSCQVPVVALDFETANEERGSACAVGLAWIDGLRVVRVEERLIRPEPFRFSPFNTQVHGIAAADVVDQPGFFEVLSAWFPDLIGSTVLAHNAAFDISVLRAALDRCGRRYPPLSYLCTVKIARLVWPELTSAALPAVARHLGFGFDHHRAGADAVACARVAIAAAGHLGVAGVAEIPARIGLKVGVLFETGWHPCSSRRDRRSPPPPT